MSRAVERMLMLTVDDARGASTRYRVLAHLPALRAAGFDPAVRFPLPGPRSGPLRWLRRAADIGRDLWGPSGADLLFVHRKTYPAAVAGRLRGRAPRLVFDMDDAIDLPPPSRSGDSGLLERYRRNFESTVAGCDLVLCGNRELAARLPHPRFALLPTPIDTERFAPDPGGPVSAPALGWVGHSDNLEYLEALAGPLRELSRRHPGMKLIVVADRPPRLPEVQVEFRRWTLAGERSCFDGMRVGLMPLEDSPWARGKCAFKAIQYMALGIPAVVSPVGMNLEVIRDGETGFLPRDAAAWVEALDRLLGDDALARRIGDAGRRAVERDYSLEVVSRNLVEILRGLD